MREQAGAWGAGGGGAAGRGHAGGEGSTPGQLRVEERTRAHALATLADAVAETGRRIGSCRDDPSWCGSAHDAFLRSVDDIAGRVALAATLLHDAQAAGRSAPGCPGAHA